MRHTEAPTNVEKYPSVMHSMIRQGSGSKLPFRQSMQPPAMFSTCSTSSSRFNFKEQNPGWNVIIGIEVHAQVKSRNKLFSSGPTFDQLLVLPFLNAFDAYP